MLVFVSWPLQLFAREFSGSVGQGLGVAMRECSQTHMGENLAAVVSPRHWVPKGRHMAREGTPTGYLKLPRYLAIV